MNTQRLLGVTLALAFAATFGAAVAAHHSRPGLDPNDPAIVLKGTVGEYRWKNPHVLFFWDVKDERGNVVRWVGEFGSVASSIARGMNKNTFKVGEEVAVTAIPSRAGTPVAILTKIVRADGTTVVGESD
jgi:Family of unknown function (DUF6152)